MTFEKLRY